MAVFDPFAETYDAWYATPVGRFVDAVETELAFSLFTPAPGVRILDAGCGTGNFSLKLAGAGSLVTGADLSEEMLAIARVKSAAAGQQIDFRREDVYRLSFADATFDGVFSMAMFEFLPEPERAFRELWRVLRPGGQLLIGTINRESAWGRLYMSEAYRDNSVFRYATFKTLADLAAFDRENLSRSGECLFVPPTADPADFNMEKEKAYAATERGGFICALWRKPERI